MSDITVPLEDLRLIPNPRDVQLLEGTTELSEDVRLVTSNVLPLQRKTMRSILSSAGIRVVANKKKFIIEIYVKDADEFDMPDLLPEQAAEYYEVEIRDNLVTVTSPSQVGALWGALAFTWVFRSGGKDQVIPNMLIRDWSSGKERGIMVDCTRGGPFMRVEHWQQLLDRMELVRLNHLAARIIGRSDTSGSDDELLLLLQDEENTDLNPETTRRWYSPGRGEWREETGRVPMVDLDLWGNVVNVANERAICIAPVIDIVGRQCPIPRLVPETSAKDKDGNPTGEAFCPSAAATRDFLKDFCGKIVERYYGSEPHPFHIDLTGAEDEACCQCADCAGKSRKDALDELAVWYCEMLLGLGVPRVFVWQGGQAVVKSADGEAVATRHGTFAEATSADKSPETLLVRVRDHHPGEFENIAEFATAMWYTDAPEKASVTVEDWTGAFMGREQGQVVLTAKANLKKAATALAESCNFCVATCRCADGTPLTLAGLTAAAKGAGAALDEASQAARATIDALTPFAEDKESCREYDTVCSILADAEIAAGMAAVCKALVAGDAARDQLITTIRAIEVRQSYWVADTQQEELSRILAEIDG